MALLAGRFGDAVLNFYNNKYYVKRFRENENRAGPEAMLPPIMVGGIMFAGGLFLFGCEQASPFLLPITHLFTTRRDIVTQHKLLALHHRHHPRPDGLRSYDNLPSSAESHC